MENRKDREGPAGSEAGQGGGETFKREGPVPATNDSGRTVEDMNEEAEESLVRNVEPDEPVD